MISQNLGHIRWAKWFTTVVPPVTLVVALLVYFAQARRIAQASAMGIDASILKEPSIPAYLTRSVGALYVPMVVATTAALIVLWLDRRLKKRLTDRRQLRKILRISIGVPLLAVGLIPIVAALALIGPSLRAYVGLIMPFLLAAAVLACWYGASLRNAIRGRLPTRVADEPRLGGSLLTGLLVALLLFAGVDGFAQVVGRGLARQLIEEPVQYSKPIILYSREDLQFDPADAKSVRLRGQQNDYVHRYEGLRLAFVDGDYYFIIPRTWQRSQGKIIVLNQGGMRVEFLR
jgi:hypothetical protein